MSLTIMNYVWELEYEQKEYIWTAVYIRAGTIYLRSNALGFTLLHLQYMTLIERQTK